MAAAKEVAKMVIKEDQSWLVKNLDTGEVRYVTDHEQFERPMDPKRLPKDRKPWQQWWHEQRCQDQKLLSASQLGDAAGCMALLRAAPPARANAIDGPTGRSALHLASANGSAEIVQVLLQAHATPEHRSFQGLTPLHVSAFQSNLQVTKVLLAHRADANVPSQDGHLPLHLASKPEMLLELESLTWSDGYQRTADATGTLRRNGRFDAVQRLLTRRSVEGEAPEAERPSRRSLESVGSTGSRTSSSSCFTRLRDSEREPVNPKSFEFLVRLGRGAFGEVFQVRHKVTGKNYAMKVLHKERIMSSNLLRYAMTERNILSYIQHPYIVSLQYAFQTQKHLVLVMQFCPGGNLQQLIQRYRGGRDRFPPPLAQLYLGEVLLALKHLHARKIIYRDLKPDNVVLDTQGHALLTDFGLSKDGVQRHLGTRTHCGSVAYIAPEVLLRQKYNHTVDIYNLGVLLYNMLIGLPPFFHHEKEILQRNIMYAPLDLPRAVSFAARSFIHGTMVREPRNRLGASSTDELQRHDYFADMDFELLQQRKVPLPEQLPDGEPKMPSKPGSTPKLPRSCSGVAGWDFEAPKATETCMPRRPRSWRLRVCGLRW
ncbi:unnamed protein product [Durusdinium trenchii]|uniref:Uncharacterized protein n=4 Tax=Durusdinium trenchii TaxID=1381693 RepID=A0ABP0PYK1_9DINO